MSCENFEESLPIRAVIKAGAFGEDFGSFIKRNELWGVISFVGHGVWKWCYLVCYQEG